MKVNEAERKSMFDAPTVALSTSALKHGAALGST